MPDPNTESSNTDNLNTDNLNTESLNTDVANYLMTSPGSNFLNRQVTLLAHWEGANNLLWRVECAGQEAVLKYYLDAGQARGRRQFDGQERYHPLGIAPKPLWFDRYPTGLSRQVLVYQWLPGEPLTAAASAGLVRFAQAVAQVHQGDPNDVRRFSPNPLNLDYLWNVLQGGMPQLQQWLQSKQVAALSAALRELTANAQALVTAALPLWQGVAPTPIHGDLKLENVIESLGTVVLLDWEMFGLGDAAYDVAHFLQMSQRDLSAEQQALWLESYLATFDQPGLAQRIDIYQRLLPLQHLTYLLHGLRQSRAAEADMLRANQPFLQATIVAAMAAAGSTLNSTATVPDQELAALFD